MTLRSDQEETGDGQEPGPSERTRRSAVARIHAARLDTACRVAILEHEPSAVGHPHQLGVRRQRARVEGTVTDEYRLPVVICTTFTKTLASPGLLYYSRCQSCKCSSRYHLQVTTHSSAAAISHRKDTLEDTLKVLSPATCFLLASLATSECSSCSRLAFAPCPRRMSCLIVD